MKKILITGALGQDGLILSKILLKNKYKVFGIVKNYKKIRVKKVTYQKVNLSKINIIKKEFDKIKPDVIIHFGSENPSKNEYIKKTIFNNNYTIMINLIDYVKLNRRIKFIYSNSSQIFSDSVIKANENSKINSKNYYTKYRINALNYLLKNKKKYNLNCTNLILFNHDSKFRNKKFLLPRLIKSIKQKNYNFIKEIYSQNIQMDFSHAEDICYAVYLLIKNKKNPNNLILSSGKITKINKLIDRYINKNFLNKIKIKKSKTGIIGNCNKAKRILGWKSKKNIFDAAQEIYNNS